MSAPLLFEMEEYIVRIGGVEFRVITDYSIKIEDSYAPFLVKEQLEPDVTIVFSREYEKAPKVTGTKSGEDLLLEFYSGEKQSLCVAKGGQKGPLAVTVWDDDYVNVTCWMNTEAYEPHQSLGNLMRLIPMRRVLQYYKILFFHAAQIVLDETGILFTAPSGTGKTTQARLWEKYRKAQIICNDRTLVREGRTYGYPMDGSQPVISGEVHQLGAIVVLGQALENKVSCLRPGEALAALMPQLVFDCWDREMREMAMDQLLNLIQRVPVYRLDCRPDEAAVACLEEKLMEDEVI